MKLDGKGQRILPEIIWSFLMLPDVILEDDDHEVSVGESIASKELAAIEAQPWTQGLSRKSGRKI